MQSMIAESSSVSALSAQNVGLGRPSGAARISAIGRIDQSDNGVYVGSRGNTESKAVDIRERFLM
jgi:hypothetical protein